MELFFTTLFVGAVGGLIFKKFRIPGALIIGSIVFVSIFNIFFDLAFVYKEGRLLAQVIAGAFIGAGISKAEIIHMKYLAKPASIVIVSLLILSIIIGTIIYFISPMDLITSLLSAVPGGMTYMPLISDEIGADSSKVAIMQFVRMMFGIGALPYIIKFFGKNTKKIPPTEKLQEIDTIIKETHTVNDAMITLGVALFFGYVGNISGVPSGTLTFALFSIIILKLNTKKAFVPKRVKQFAQVLAGSYIGSGIDMNDILELKYMVLPIIVLIIGYFTACIFIGKILEKYSTFTLEEGMFAATPAGASDMALLLEDFGIHNKDIIVIQILRLMVVISIFPQVMIFIVSMVESL